MELQELLPDAYDAVGRGPTAVAFMCGLVVMMLLGRMVGIP